MHHQGQHVHGDGDERLVLSRVHGAPLEEEGEGDVADLFPVYLLDATRVMTSEWPKSTPVRLCLALRISRERVHSHIVRILPCNVNDK